MLGLNKKLKSVGSKGKSIKVTIAGVGQMERSQVSHIRKLEFIRICFWVT